MESNIYNYTIHSFYYNKNSNNLIDWVNPTSLERNFKTKIQISFSSFKKNIETNFYEFHFIDKILKKEKKGKIPFIINKLEYNNQLFSIS